MAIVISGMKKLICAAIVLFCALQANSALAKSIHGGLNPGRATINIGMGDLVASSVVNVLHAAYYNFGSNADASKIDADGFPTSSPSSAILLAFDPSSTFTNTQYKLSWPATRTFTMTFLGAESGCTAVGATVTGCSSGNMTVTTTGGAGSVTFTTTDTQFTIQFPSGGTYAAGSGEVALYRVSDESRYLAGEFFTTEFIDLVKNLRPYAVRMMGWTNGGSANFNGETTWAFRIPPTAVAWKQNRIAPTAWAGNCSGTNTYTVSPSASSPANWTDGETIQCLIGASGGNTSTTGTLTITGHTGSKTIYDQYAVGLNIGDIPNNGIATFVYDGLLDKVLVESITGAQFNGMPASVPIEAQVQLCNRVRANCWITIPAWASDDYVTQQATYVFNNLSADLFFMPEYGNELWNQGFPAWYWASVRGQAFGFPSSSGVNFHGWYGFRVRQIMGDLIPAVWSGRMSKLRRVLAYQAAGDQTTYLYRMQGQQLAPSGVGTGQGNATWNSWTGSANYTASPNRPIDVVESIAYAPYAGGTNLMFGPDINGVDAGGDTPTTLNAPFYQALITAIEAGNTATANSLIDGDIRGGLTAVKTVTASVSTFTTPSAHGFVAGFTDVAFTVAGGTLYSGLTAGQSYRVDTTPTPTTFTITAYQNNTNNVGGAAINAGSAGTGTVSVGWMGGSCYPGFGACSTTTYNHNTVTMQKLNSNWYLFAEWLATQFDMDRNSRSVPLLRNDQYEGSLELQGPTNAQLSALSVTGASSCAANPAGCITTSIETWKNSSLANATIQLYYNQFMGLDPNMASTFGLMLHSKTPAQLVLQNGCGNVWAIVCNQIPNAAPYQLYYGFGSFSANWLLKRDLDPASNDNDPMWLEKAA